MMAARSSRAMTPLGSRNIMIGSLLKQLIVASGRYVGFHSKRTLGISAQQAPAQSTPDRALPPIKLFKPAGNFEWQSVHTHAQAYEDSYNTMVEQFLQHPPRMALDVGCNTGRLGEAIKKQYPDSVTWGIEPDAGAAAIASQRLPRVLATPIEDVDWAAEGVGIGTFDTVFLLDVLEHIYDPWKTLLALRGMLAEGAQVLVSIPNMRNILLMQDLANGTFRYRPVGLLDITHIRFFTRDDLMRTFYQTGFRVTRTGLTACEPGKAIFRKYADGPFPQMIEAGRVAVEASSQDDLQQLCALQILFTLEPVEYASLAEEEKRWVDDPHPATVAYAGPDVQARV